MTFPLEIPPELRAAVAPGTGVLLALSGGVDSSVALAVLRHLGADVTAVTFKNFCYGDAEAAAGPAALARSCCSLEAIADARRVAARLGAPHWVADVSDLFDREVIAPFVSEYAAGRTPNPCQACNARVRFPELVRLADRLDCALVATGHYARCVREDGGARLRRGLDPAKDQAYFLYGVGRELLPRVVFPLGWAAKVQVRAAAIRSPNWPMSPCRLSSWATSRAIQSVGRWPLPSDRWRYIRPTTRACVSAPVLR